MTFLRALTCSNSKLNLNMVFTYFMGFQQRPKWLDSAPHNAAPGTTSTYIYEIQYTCASQKGLQKKL